MTSQFFTNELLDRFWSKTDLVGPCWNWKSAKNNKGYGVFHLDDKVVLAHRLSYQIYNGLIPTGLDLDHLCRNKLCVNPTHLEAVSHKENNLRGFSKSAINAKKTHCIYGHELKNDNLYNYQNSRHCKICKNKHSKIQNRINQSFKRIGELLN